VCMHLVCFGGVYVCVYVRERVCVCSCVCVHFCVSVGVCGDARTSVCRIHLIERQTQTHTHCMCVREGERKTQTYTHCTVSACV